MDALDRAILGTLMPGFAGPTLPAWLRTQLEAGLGAVCLFASNIVDAQQLADLTAEIHEARPAVLVATDEEGGDVTRLHHASGSPVPGAALLGRLDSPPHTFAVGRAVGRELAQAGVDLNLAPVADVNSNPDNPVIGVRSYGADPALVGRHVAAAIQGLQSAGVAATAKHFPGHGDTASDSHHALPVVSASRAELDARELVPFGAAVQAGCLAVMTSHLLVPALDAERPVTFSPAALAILRDELHFDGVIVSDALDMAGASGGRGVPEAAVLSLAAGVDLLCLGTGNTAADLAAIRAHVRAAVQSGRLPRERVEEAAGRVATLSAIVSAARVLDRSGGRVPPADDAAGESVVPGLAHAEGPACAAGFTVQRSLEPLVAPVFVRLGSAANMAAGEGVWGVGEHLRRELDAALPGADCLDAADLDDVAAVLAAGEGRPLVVQGRDLARVGFLAEAARLVRDARPDALVVELGWPAASGFDVATYGSGRATSLALVRMLAEGVR